MKLELSNVSNWLPVVIGPSRSLLETLKAERKCSLFSSKGIAPVRLLLDSSSFSRLVRLQIACGISPEKLLKLKSSISSAFSQPISGGITPVKLFLATFTSARRMPYSYFQSLSAGPLITNDLTL